MPAAGHDVTLIPFGLDRLPDAGAARVGLPLARGRAGAMLRLNDGALTLPAPVPGEARTLESRLAARLKQLCGGWNAAAHGFIDGYFAFLHGEIDRHRAEIGQRLAPFEGLFAAGDVLYAAPLPLPRAFLPGEEVPVDIAFWLGGRVQAVLFAPSRLTPGAERRRRERLEAAGVDVAVLGSAKLAAPDLFPRLLGPQAARFWAHDVLPSAPGAARLPAF